MRRSAPVEGRTTRGLGPFVTSRRRAPDPSVAGIVLRARAEGGLPTFTERSTDRAAAGPAPGETVAGAPAVPRHDTAIVDEPSLGRIASADGLFVTDERQRIVTWSSAAQRLLGYSPEEAHGLPCYQVLMGREPDGHPICRKSCRVTANARRGRGTASYEVAARSREGLVKCFGASVLVLGGGAKTFRVIHLLREIDRPSAPAPARRPALASARVGEERPPIAESLTRRELEVLRLLAGGLSTDEIATALTISAFTARNHIANVQRKLGARNRLEIVVLGMRGGLV